MEELYESVESILRDEPEVTSVFTEEYEKSGDLDSAILKVLQTVQERVLQTIQDDGEIWRLHIPDSNRLGRLVSKLSSDDLKLEQMEKLHKLNQESGHGIVHFGKTIKSLSTDELKIEKMNEFEDSLDYSDLKEERKLEIILSLDDINLIIEQLNMIKIEPVENLADIFTENHWDSNSAFSRFYSIIEKQPDEVKVRFMDAWNKAVPCDFWHNEWISADMIKNIEDDTLKEQQIRKYIDEYGVRGEAWCEALPTISDDEIKANLIEYIVKAWGDKDGKENLDEDILRAIDSLFNREIKERLLTSYLDEIKDSFGDEIAYLDYIKSYASQYLYHTAEEDGYSLSNSKDGRVTYSAEKGIIIPVQYLLDPEVYDEHFKEANFEYFSEYMPKDLVGKLMVKTQDERNDFFKFAKALGCFSDELILDEDGYEDILGPKATLKLMELLERGKLKLGDFHKLVDNMDSDIQPSQEFFEWVSTYDITEVQSVLDRTNKLKDEIIPNHILGVQLKEDSILDSIEKIKMQTEAELTSGRETIEDLWQRRFTYEWLSKNDPANDIIGMCVDYYATLADIAYDTQVSESSLFARDVQNLIIRESTEDGTKGRIISKGTVYVDEEQGYAVINGFALNGKYRNHEYEDESSYLNERYEDDPVQEQTRDEIFEAYQRGIQAFIEEYDRQHPNNPIKQVNVGWTYNRLKKQIERFEKATENLSVPEEYEFEDEKDTQYVLYRREEPEVQKDEQENGGER